MRCLYQSLLSLHGKLIHLFRAVTLVCGHAKGTGQLWKRAFLSPRCCVLRRKLALALAACRDSVGEDRGRLIVAAATVFRLLSGRGHRHNVELAGVVEGRGGAAGARHILILLFLVLSRCEKWRVALIFLACSAGHLRFGEGVHLRRVVLIESVEAVLVRLTGVMGHGARLFTLHIAVELEEICLISDIIIIWGRFEICSISVLFR